METSLRPYFLLYLAATVLPLASFSQVVDTNLLKINQLTPSTYLHISYLDGGALYGKVPCNGVVLVDNGEAIVLDTPVSDSASAALINWIKTELKASIIAVVPTHFHIDCLGGLSEFHKQGIPSYGLKQTVRLAKGNGAEVPQKSFSSNKKFQLGEHKVLCKHFGAGHTQDNVIVYYEPDELLFGGCLIKSVGAGKGNLADADVKQWSKTVANIKGAFPNLSRVVPGHGKPGGIELLDFTIDMFH